MADSAHDPAPARTLDARILEQLACPVCFGELREAPGAKGIACGECGRVYPLVDGIPVLIAERAFPGQS